MLLILLLVIVVLAIGVAPAWPYSHTWGYYPVGGVGLLLIVVLVVLLVSGRL
jgi:hypothetical protein